MLRIEGAGIRRGTFRLDDVTFAVPRGAYVVLLGESGAGKTLILEAIAGLVPLSRGRILFGDTDLSDRPIQTRPVGLVYQDHALFPHLTVRGNIQYPLPRSERHQVEVLAEHVGAKGLLDRRPQSLSLGERQRVALARTLARRPSVLMLDEPLASLDTASRAGIRALLRRLNREGQTILHVTHDYEEAVALASQVVVLEKGTVAQVGTPDQVFHHPRTPFVADFVGLRNFFQGRVVRDGETSSFETCGLRFVLPDGETPGDGCLVFDATDVTLSRERPSGSARNVFQGTVADVEKIPHGVEVSVDIGAPIIATITQASREGMGIAPGAQLWVSCKSSALRFLPSQEGA